MTTTYALTIDLQQPLTIAIETLRAALAAEQMGIVSEVDVQATLKAKLGLDNHPQKLLGICSPKVAHAILSAEPDLGAMLPCGCSVSESKPGVTRIALVHVDDSFGLQRLVKHHGTGGGANQRHVVLLEQRQDALGMRCATGHEQGQYFALFNQGFGVFLGELGVKLVVEGDDLNFLAVHAAFGIDGIDVQVGTEHGFLHCGRNCTGHAHSLANDQLRLGQAMHQKKSETRDQRNDEVHSLLQFFFSLAPCS